MATLTRTTSAARGNVLYLVLMVVGTLVPGIYLSGWFLGPSPTFGQFFQWALANPVAQGLTADLLISSFVFWLFAATELRRLGRPLGWMGLFIGTTLGIGLSCSLPLFLYFRSRWER